MPYVPPIVAYVSHRGDLICTECCGDEIPLYDCDGTVAAQYADNSALDHQSCDRCHRPFVETRTNYWEIVRP